MSETYDTGLLPEAEMHIRAEDSTPYEIARQVADYPQQRIFAAAELVGAGPERLAELIELSRDSDSVVRYWAVVGLSALGAKAAPASQALAKALTDDQPNVRFAVAGALCRLGSCENALPVLAEGLEDEREPVVLYAAREIQSIGNKARPIVPQMKKTRTRCKHSDGSYKNDDYAMFIDWALAYALQNCKQ